jgi:hypothetical protein
MDSDQQTAGAPPIPAELRGSVPRKTRATTNGISLELGGLLFLVFAVGMTIWATVATAHQMQLRQELRSGSSVTTGWKEKLVSGGRGQDEKLSYSFTVGARKYTGEARVPLAQLYGVAHSDLLSIRYLTADPTINHPADWEWSPQWTPFLVGPLAAGMGLLLLLSIRADRQLAQEGTAVLAIVTHCSPSRGGFIAQYEFRTEDGREMQGTGWSTDARKAGAKVCILYMPRNPKQNQPYPGPNMRIAE